MSLKFADTKNRSYICIMKNNLLAINEILLIAGLAYLLPIVYNMFFEATAHNHLHGYTILLVMDLSLITITGIIAYLWRRKN